MKLLKLALLASTAIAMIGCVSAEQLSQQIDQQAAKLKKQPGAGTQIRGRAIARPIPARSAPQARSRVRDGLINAGANAAASFCPAPLRGVARVGTANILNQFIPGGNQEVQPRAVYRNKRYQSRIMLRAAEKSNAIKNYKVEVSGEQICPCPEGTTRVPAGSERKFNRLLGYDFTIQYADCVGKGSAGSGGSFSSVSSSSSSSYSNALP